MLDSIVFLLAGTLAAATPLLFAAMGEAVVEKAGVLNLSIEGMMAVGAATGFAVATISGSPVSGFAMAAIGSALALLKSGDHLIVPEDLYGGSYRYLTQLMMCLAVRKD